MALQPLYGKGPHPLLWAILQTTHGKITVSGILNCLKYCMIFVVCTKFTNVPMGHIIKPGATWVGNPCLSANLA